MDGWMVCGIASKQLLYSYIFSNITIKLIDLLFCSAGGSEATPTSPGEDHPALCQVEQ
jgi:hypothetical protein